MGDHTAPEGHPRYWEGMGEGGSGFPVQAQPYYPRSSGQQQYPRQQQQRGGQRGDYAYYQPHPPRGGGYYQQHNRDNGFHSHAGGDRSGRRYAPGYNGAPSAPVDGPPRDMETLKAAITAAEAGTGAVGRALSSSTFRPRARAFTSLIQMCGKVPAPSLPAPLPLVPQLSLVKSYRTVRGRELRALDCLSLNFVFDRQSTCVRCGRVLACFIIYFFFQRPGTDAP
jgi:hypothetical protein